MGSFLGCKIYGVNSQTAYPVDAMELAEYLTSEAAQIERYKALNYGPSNVNALADETIASNLALQALSAQSEFAISQMVLGGFWTPAEAFGAELEAHSTADLQTKLDHLHFGKGAGNGPFSPVLTEVYHAQKNKSKCTHFCCSKGQYMDPVILSYNGYRLRSL